MSRAVYSKRVSMEGLFAGSCRWLRLQIDRSITACKALESLGQDRGDDTRPDRLAAFADGEAQARLAGDGRDQHHLDLDVVPRHHHLHALREGHDAGDV